MSHDPMLPEVTGFGTRRPRASIEAPLLRFESRRVIARHKVTARLDEPGLATATGRILDPISPDTEGIDIEDIARALSRQCRFAGHLRHDVEHYSVAQHSVLVSQHCEPQNALIGLLHDAAEAYAQDIVRPNKRLLGHQYAVLEATWQLAIGLRFGLPTRLMHLPKDVQSADEVLCATEWRDLLAPGLADRRPRVKPLGATITPLRAFDAYALFMERFRELTGASDAA